MKEDDNTLSQEQYLDLYMRDGMDLRAKVLHKALHIEDTVNRMLKKMLGVKTGKNIPTSFDWKINLLLELEAVENDDDRALFLAFQQVRNKFVHNLEANSLETCFNLAPGAKAKVLEIAKQAVASFPEKTKEGPEGAMLEFGLIILMDKVTDLAEHIAEVAEQRSIERHQGQIGHRFFLRFNDKMYEPLAKQLDRLKQNLNVTLTGQQAYGMFIVAARETAMNVFQSIDEATLENLNAERAKYGEPPLNELPTPAILPDNLMKKHPFEELPFDQQPAQ